MFDIFDKSVEENKRPVSRTPEEQEVRLGELQREMKAAGIPTVIVFEGWSASGKGTMMSRLIRSLDPRGFKVYSMTKPTDEERRYPRMRRYWLNLPINGNISVFDRSWYRCFDFREGKKLKEDDREKIDSLIDFESQLAAEGYLVIKFFLHISSDEQRKRFNKLNSVKSTAWRVKKSDVRQNENYVKVYRMLCELFDRTDLPGAPWHIIDTSDRDTAAAHMYQIVIASMEKALEQKSRGFAVNPVLPSYVSPTRPQVTVSLADVDLSQKVSENAYKKRLKVLQDRLFVLQNELYRRRIPMVIAFEGWDAAGKGGNIRRIAQALDPRGYEVIPVGSPTPDEKNRHFLWRFWRSVPRSGHTAIFDRTWYGRVLVERIEGFATEEEWQRAYDEINRFEYSLVSAGAIVVKFWLQIDSDEQLVRFTARQNTPSKQWKITDEDWRNRAKWGEYETAVNDMLQKTNTPEAPWIVVESNDKKYARLRTLEEIIALIEKRLAQKDD